jgi:hypothetical protein
LLELGGMIEPKPTGKQAIMDHVCMKPTQYTDLYDFKDDPKLMVSRQQDDFPEYRKEVDGSLTKDAARGDMPHTQKIPSIKIMYDTDGHKIKTSLIH